VPGSVVTVLGGTDPSPEMIAALTRKFGLDQPLPIQYLNWLGNALLGDLGTSPISGRPVTELIAQRLGNTMLLAGTAIVLAAILGLTLGVVAALRQNRWADNAITALNSLILSIPNFWIGILMILLLSVYLRLLPSGGWRGFSHGGIGSLRYLIMPALALSLDSAAMIARLVRASVLDELSRDYVTVARAKGLTAGVLMRRHVARNAAIPVLTILGMRFGQMLGGAVLIESVFNWPGLGRLTVEAIENRDVVLVQGALLYFVVIYMTINLLVDLSYGWLNPRVRSSIGGSE
jgi:ABC-type dipeptide/oligopeptide/nickel transport system permease component